MVCSDCSRLCDVEVQLAEVKAALKNVTEKLSDAQQLNFVLERYSLTLDNKLLVSRGAYQKLEKLVETLTNSRIVNIARKEESVESNSDVHSNVSADEDDDSSNCDQSFAMDGANSDHQENSDDDADTEVDEQVFDDPTVSLITTNRESLSRGDKSEKALSASQVKRRRRSKNSKRELKSKDQEYLQGSVYRCAMCSFEDTRSTRFSDHVLTHEGYRPFKCNFTGCLKTYYRYDSLKVHEKVHDWDNPHLSVASRSDSKAKKPPKVTKPRQAENLSLALNSDSFKAIETFKCELCSFTSPYASKLASHIRVHPGYQPFKCDFAGCSRAYNLIQTLVIHKRKHTGERPYVCQYEGCSMAFDMQKKILKHNREVHNEQARLPLVRTFDGPSTSRDGENSLDVDTDEELPSAFAQRTHRSRGNQGYQYKRKRYEVPAMAIRDPNTGRVKTYSCEHCDFTSNFVRYFQEHAETHPGYERPFKCHYIGCSKAYKKGELLVRHIREHTGEKRYHCSVEGCGLSFKDRVTLDYHQWKLHRDIARIKGLECPDEKCTKVFFTKYNLNGHVKRVHPELVKN